MQQAAGGCQSKKRKKRQARQNGVFSSAPMSPVKQWSKGVGGLYYLVVFL